MDSRDHVDRGGRVNGGMRFAYSTLRVEQSRPRYRARNIVGRNKAKPHCAATSRRRSRLCCCYSPHAHDPFPSRTGRGEIGVQSCGQIPPLPAIADFPANASGGERVGVKGRSTHQRCLFWSAKQRQAFRVLPRTGQAVVRQRPAQSLGDELFAFLDAKRWPVAIPPHRPTVAQVPQSPPL